MDTINKKLECYWSPLAKETVSTMVSEFKMDKDLAIACLEQLWPEEVIYNLEETSDEQRKQD